MKIDKIKLHSIEIYNEMACCIAYCIGATYDNVEDISCTNIIYAIFEKRNLSGSYIHFRFKITFCSGNQWSRII